MRICVETLGCKVNAYESEVIKELFIKNNDEIVQLEESPDCIIINTCTVTNQSDAKSRRLIRKARNLNKNAILVVCGCSSQYHKEALDNLDIDILLGNYDKSKIVEYVNNFKNEKQSKFYDLKKVDFEDMSINYFDRRTRAFVKIQDGCNNYCSYCIIPYMRGTNRYKEPTKVIKEIENLVNNNYKEIVLTGINTGSYGNDNYSLTSLLKDLSKIENLERIRISSIEVTCITDEFIEELKVNPKICNHLHIPIQSGSDNTLKQMNRKYTIKKYIDIINKIRKVRPDINITTDLIVGFINETEEDFKETINNINKIKFTKIHVFPYSKRDGTLASTMKDNISPQVKKERSKKILEISNNLEYDYYKNYLNKEVEILTEESTNNKTTGHTSNYIKVEIDKELETNKLIKVKIKEINKGYVKGEIK